MSARVAGSVVAFCVFASLASGACSDEPIVLATIPETMLDGGMRPEATRCVLTSDCPQGSFCDKKDCTEAAGTCVPFPALCGNEEHVSCGCDGVSYFNDCLRRAAGVAPAHADECGAEGVVCGGPEKAACPGAAGCAKLLGFASGPCTGYEKGTCWVVPLTCPVPAHADRWDDCDRDHCIDTCNAIRSGKTYFRASHCE